MVHGKRPLRYGLNTEQWQASKDEILALMIATARDKTTITYGELAHQMLTISPHPGSYVFHALLRAVCQDERLAGRGMLCAVVVAKATGIPGQGFFKAMIKHGYDCTDIRACWEAEITRLYDIWDDNSSS